MAVPKISVITPSLNQGIYIEETILSVVGQFFDNIEYIIMDGGSSDNSVEIIRKYEKKLFKWVSETDTGQANALNKGFNHSSGDILAWINSDDFYLPGTFQFVSEILDISKPQLLFGNSILFNAHEQIHYGSNVTSDHKKFSIELLDYIIQPSCFFTRKTWELIKPLNEKFHFGFDWEFFIRCKIFGVEFLPVDKYLSIYRKHATHKSGAEALKNERLRELIEIFEKYNPKEDMVLLKSLNGKTEALRQLEYYLKKLGLGKLYKIMATIRYPAVFTKFDFNKIESIKKMF